jgi:hypothetical protein
VAESTPGSAIISSTNQPRPNFIASCSWLIKGKQLLMFRVTGSDAYAKWRFVLVNAESFQDSHGLRNVGPATYPQVASQALLPL